MGNAIKRITVTNYLRIKGIDIPITKPVNVFVGKNRAGKSSLASIFEFVATGLSRGVEFKKYRGGLVHRGATSGAISIEAESFSVTRKVTPSAPLTVLDKNKKPMKDLVFTWTPIAFNPDLFFGAGEDARKNILLNVAGESTQEAILAELEKREVRNAEMIAKAIVEHGWDVTREQVIEQRRDLKRQAAQIKTTAEPPKPALDVSEPQLLAEMSSVRSQRDAVLLKIGALANKPQNLEADLDNIDTALCQYSDTIKSKTSFIDEREKILSRHKAAVAANKTAIKERHNALSLIDGGDGVIPALDFIQCPVMGGLITCPVPQAERDKFKKNRAQVIARNRQAAEEINGEINKLVEENDAEEIKLYDVEAEIKRAKTIVSDSSRAIDQLTARRDALRESAAAVAGIAETMEDLEKQRDELLEKASILSAQEFLLSKYRTAIHDYQSQQALLPRIEADIKRLDTLDELLSESGIRQSLAKPGADKFIEHLRKVGKQYFGVDIDIDPEVAMPVLDGMPYASLCKSEQWICQLLVQEALASASGADWLIIDGADILDFDWRGALLDFVSDAAKVYSFIGVFATRGGAMISIPVDAIIDGWEIKDGECLKI